jgi:hypothetical protein
MVGVGVGCHVERIVTNRSRRTIEMRVKRDKNRQNVSILDRPPM